MADSPPLRHARFPEWSASSRASPPKEKDFQLNRHRTGLANPSVAEFASLIFEMASSDCAIGGYEEYRGHLGLRNAIADLDREIGVESEPLDGMLITSGRQVLTLIGRSLESGAQR